MSSGTIVPVVVMLGPVLALLVGFIVLLTQLAEKKEKQLILGLLQTPMREVEWLLAKVCTGMILVAVAALLFHLLLRFDFEPGGGLSYTVFLMAGAFCFSAFGIFVGFFMPNPGKCASPGPAFLSAAPASFRARRFFRKAEQRGAAASFLPVLPADQVDPSGERRSRRFSAAIAGTPGVRAFCPVPVLSATDKTLADVTYNACIVTEHDIMTKERSSKREDKKKPAMTPKQKKDAKILRKKSEKSTGLGL